MAQVLPTYASHFCTGRYLALLLCAAVIRSTRFIEQGRNASDVLLYGWTPGLLGCAAACCEGPKGDGGHPDTVASTERSDKQQSTVAPEESSPQSPNPHPVDSPDTTPSGPSAGSEELQSGGDTLPLQSGNVRDGRQNGVSSQSDNSSQNLRHDASGGGGGDADVVDSTERSDEQQSEEELEPRPARSPSPPHVYTPGSASSGPSALREELRTGGDSSLRQGGYTGGVTWSGVSSQSDNSSQNLRHDASGGGAGDADMADDSEQSDEQQSEEELEPRPARSPSPPHVYTPGSASSGPSALREELRTGRDRVPFRSGYVRSVIQRGIFSGGGSTTQHLQGDTSGAGAGNTDTVDDTQRRDQGRRMEMREDSLRRGLSTHHVYSPKFESSGLEVVMEEFQDEEDSLPSHVEDSPGVPGLGSTSRSCELPESLERGVEVGGGYKVSFGGASVPIGDVAAQLLTKTVNVVGALFEAVHRDTDIQPALMRVVDLTTLQIDFFRQLAKFPAGGTQPSDRSESHVGAHGDE